jgi:hypothetical protein
MSLPVVVGTGAGLYSVESRSAGPLEADSGDTARPGPVYSENSVPLPAAGWLLLSALSGLGLIARRRAGRDRRSRDAAHTIQAGEP